MEETKRYLEIVEAALGSALSAGLPGERPAVLTEAMRYAVGAGGKRIRPLVCLAGAVAAGGRAEDAAKPAAAIELLHNYTLIHDDLPAMDNDTMRRGKPSVWAKYGEADAILAGDALQALAFAVAAESPRNVPEIVATLGDAGVGVVQGQVEDLGRGEGGALPEDSVAFVYERKTAELFVAAAVMGGYAGGGGQKEIAALRRYAVNLGLAFQYEDDLLDGDSPFPREKTERLVELTTDAAVAALADLPGDTSFLEALARRLAGRKE